MTKSWSTEAWEGYLYWQGQDKKTLRKINSLIKDIERGGYIGIGNPKPLTGNLSSFWRREINEKDRLVYRINDGTLEIISCKGHYDHK